MIPYHFSTMKGFTLIETLVAVSIIMLAVAGPLYTASRAIVAAQNTRDQLTASYLAQEGIEYVRMVRDNAYLDAYLADPGTATVAGWDDFLLSIASCTTACTLDPSGFKPIQFCTIGSCPPLYLSESDHRYTQNSIDTLPTQFIRTIQTTVVSSTEQKVVSTVTWDFHGTDRSVTITDYLTSWQ